MISTTPQAVLGECEIIVITAKQAFRNNHLYRAANIICHASKILDTYKSILNK